MKVVEVEEVEVVEEEVKVLLVQVAVGPDLHDVVRRCQPGPASG